MTVDQLLAALAELRITLTVMGDQIKYRGPTGTLTPDLREAISQCREEIIARLTTPKNGKIRGEVKCIHVDPLLWIGEPSRNGRIRSTCPRCGRFVGYRPSDI